MTGHDPDHFLISWLIATFSWSWLLCASAVLYCEIPPLNRALIDLTSTNRQWECAAEPQQSANSALRNQIPPSHTEGSHISVLNLSRVHDARRKAASVAPLFEVNALLLQDKSDGSSCFHIHLMPIYCCAWCLKYKIYTKNMSIYTKYKILLICSKIHEYLISNKTKCFYLSRNRQQGISLTIYRCQAESCCFPFQTWGQ